MLVQEIMTHDPACCPADTGLQAVTQMMIDYDCGCNPVVDNSNSKTLVGIVTDRDICCRSIAEGKNPLDLTAGDVMTGNVITVTPETSVEECCNLMESNQIRRIAVVDEAGSCCGIVAQTDIAVYASDRETAEVVQEVSKAAS